MAVTVDPEKEITRLWRALHEAQDVGKRTFYQWREAALELAGPDANPLDIVLKVWEIIGTETGKTYLPRLNWLKGEEGFIMMLARTIAGTAESGGAVVRVEQGSSPYELYIVWDRCPWPTFAKEYEASMEEDVLGCDKYLESMLQIVNVFFNTNLVIETQKAIPRGDGMCVRRLYKPNK